MALPDFLDEHRAEVLDLTKARIAQRTMKAPDPEILDCENIAHTAAPGRTSVSDRQQRAWRSP